MKKSEVVEKVQSHLREEAEVEARRERISYLLGNAIVVGVGAAAISLLGGMAYLTIRIGMSLGLGC